ncbi:MAG: RNA polymerase sigma factor [Ruminiclostridium sp.]
MRTDKELSELYERNMDMVYRICYMHLKNHADTEDAVQTVFLKYIRSIVTFRDHEHEKAWFIVTARNCCRDTLKSFWRSRQVDMDRLPDISTWDREESEELLTQLLSLPEKYKIVLYLYYYEDYS